MPQRMFCGADEKIGFRWSGDWYESDMAPADKAARRARDQFAMELKARGDAPRKFSLGDQLVSKDGIGSGRPHIELWTKCCGVNW